MDLSVLTQPGTVTAEWKAVIPNAGFGGNLFSARNSHTVCTYESRMYLFGGFYHNIQAGGAYTNDCNNPAVQCTWFNDLWKWTPPYGVPGPVANTWQQVQPASNVVPAPRAGHVAHFLEDSRMLVFGGYGVNNAPLNDLWQFTEHDMIWTKLEPGVCLFTFGGFRPCFCFALCGWLFTFPSSPTSRSAAGSRPPALTTPLGAHIVRVFSVPPR